MISIDKVSRKYGDFIAVDKVSFSISPGEIVGLLGHNAAGKTTIMKMLTGYLEPTDGDIVINGCNIIDQRHQIQQEIGYLPENCPVYPEMTVVDYLDYAASLHGIAAKDRPEMIIEAIEKTALADKAHQTIGTLSRGYRQRAGVAQAILHKPKILILDEPTNGLDPTQIQQMRELVKDLAKSSTVIISTHILQEVQAVCDRVIIIRNGQLAMDTRLDTLQSEKKLMLTLDSTLNDPESVLLTVEGVRTVDRVASAVIAQNLNSYVIELGQDCNREDTAAAVAKRVHEEGWSLYSLQFEARDLEAIFAQISSQ